MSSSSLSASCIFCKIIKGEIPSRKLAETAHSYAFLDVGPIARGPFPVPLPFLYTGITRRALRSTSPSSPPGVSRALTQ